MSRPLARYDRAESADRAMRDLEEISSRLTGWVLKLNPLLVDAQLDPLMHALEKIRDADPRGVRAS